MERRNEVDVLHVKMDVKSAQDFLAMVAEKGEAMVEVQDLLAFARPWITDWPEHLARLERTAESHDRCTPTELANWNKVSRQTVYNWRDRGLLVYDGRRINVPGTVALWKFLIKLRRYFGGIKIAN